VTSAPGRNRNNRKGPMFLTIEVTKDDHDFKAHCVELDVDVRSDSSERAIEKLKKVIDFYITTAREEDPLETDIVKKLEDLTNERIH
jgi:hypothetical protein